MNIIHPVTEEPKVSLEVLMLLLNSQVVDRIFRCLSGSVAVSATELHALPLPPIEKLEELEALLDRNHSSTELKEFAEKIITKAYGLEE